MLKERQRKTLFVFLDAIRRVMDESIDFSSVCELEAEVNLALAMMERDFPADIQVYTIINLYGVIIYTAYMHAWT